MRTDSFVSVDLVRLSMISKILSYFHRDMKEFRNLTFTVISVKDQEVSVDFEGKLYKCRDYMLDRIKVKE